MATAASKPSVAGVASSSSSVDKHPATPSPPIDAGESQSDSDEDETATGEVPSTGKKKKKKRRTTAQKREAKKRTQEQAQAVSQEAGKAQEEPYRGVYAYLARNKHLKYISLFNGPWMSLSQRDLETYQVVNSNERSRASLRGLLEDPLASQVSALSLTASPSRPSSPSKATSLRHSAYTPGKRFSQAYLDSVASDSIPPPLDIAVFRNTLEVRKLVDEAADLALRASSGMSSAELEALNRNPFGMGDLHGDGTGYGGGGLYGNGGGGGGAGAGNGGRRNPPMSALRQHRFRVLAVAKLAAAYRIDEIAAAVIVMQQGENLEEIAAKVSRQEPGNQDARYVAYFSEKIPSRALSPPSDIEVLDWLLACDPSCLAYYRTKGILLCTFKQDYSGAIRILTQGLAVAKAAHEAAAAGPLFSKPTRSKKSAKNSNRSDSPSFDSRPSSPARRGSEDSSPSYGKTPGDDVERTLLFHRGMAHFHHARQQIEDAVLTFEGVTLPPNRRNDEGGAWTLRNLGLKVADVEKGLYGSKPEAAKEQYRAFLGESNFKDRIQASLRKALRDLDRFLAHFPVYEPPVGSPLEQLPRFAGTSGLDPPRPSTFEEPLTFLGRRLVHHRALSPRTFSRDARRPPPVHPSRAILTSFHPFLLEAHCTRLSVLTLLGDFSAAAHGHAVLVRLTEHLEGYPLFSSPRVGSQAEYGELIERLWETWGKSRPPSQHRRSSPEEGHEEEEREETEPLPEDRAHEGSAGPANGALLSLIAISDLFSPSFRKAYIARAEEWWEQGGKVAEEAREKREAANQAAMEKTSGTVVTVKSMMAMAQAGVVGNGDMGSWEEEREKAEGRMRKIDPSYAPLTTAHTELSLCYLHAAVLPTLEAQEREELAKAAAMRPARNGYGKGKGKGKGKAVDSDEDGNMQSTNGWRESVGGSGSGRAGGSGSGSSAPVAFDAFGTSAWAGASSASAPTAHHVEGEEDAADKGKGKGKGKGKARAF